LNFASCLKNQRDHDQDFMKHNEIESCKRFHLKRSRDNEELAGEEAADPYNALFELSRRARYDVWEPGEYDLNKANSAFERVKGLFSAHSLISKSFPANSGTALLPYLSDS